MHSSSQTYPTNIKCVLRYHKTMINYGISLKCCSLITFYAYANADQAGNRDGHTSADILYPGHNLISQSPWKQRSIIQSSIEVEYYIVASTAADIAWVQSLLHELYVSLSKVPVIFCDNVKATYLYSNPVFHSQMKHMVLGFHFVHDKVSKDLLQVSQVSTIDQSTDAPTKLSA